MSRVFIVLKEDIIDFPPVLSLIEVLTRLHYKVIHLGSYSDIEQKRFFESKGVEFINLPSYDGKGNVVKKLFQQISFKKNVKKYLKNAHVSDEDRVWLIQSETIYLLSSIVYRYKTICHMFEFAESKVNWKYKLLNISLNLPATLQHAYKVVCCEYNRAQIAKGFFQLNELPIILPNKMIMSNDDFIADVPKEISPLIYEVKDKIGNKKVILYQGIFLDKERRLEEFCEAMNELSDDYIFIAMGRGSEMYENLKKRYESDRILFIPFIRPPYHMHITKMASIGVLSYFPRAGSVGRTLNPLYCAPNKIFEYSKFGIPMISNDIPALKYAFMEYNCGLCVDYPMKPKQIVDTITEIMENYDKYSQGAINYYNSVDVVNIVKTIL